MEVYSLDGILAEHICLRTSGLLPLHPHSHTMRWDGAGLHEGKVVSPAVLGGGGSLTVAGSWLEDGLGT